jgi:hypothetical protein
MNKFARIYKGCEFFFEHLVIKGDFGDPEVDLSI